MTPATAGNIIQIDFCFFIGHNDTWQASTQRVQVSTDGGSSWSNANTLGGDGGYGGVNNFLQNDSSVGDTHSGTVYYVTGNTNAHKFRWQFYGEDGGQGFYVNYNESQNAGGTAHSNVIISEWDVSASSITNGGIL